MIAALTLLRRDRGLLLVLVLFLLGLPLVTTRIYASDEIKYFAYLHSLSFDGDLNFTNDYLHWYNLDQKKYADILTLLKPNPTTGLPINEAPIGTALFWAPAFALAHGGVLVARALGARVAADGYSPPYIAAVCYASYCYGWAGLLLIYGLLRRLFSPFAATLALVTTWLGTSAFFYMVIAPPWSHAVSLFTVSLFTTVWLRTRAPAGRTWRAWAALGLCAGLMMLVREQDALFLALPAVETLGRLWPLVAGRGRRLWAASPAVGFAAPGGVRLAPIPRPVAPAPAPPATRAGDGPMAAGPILPGRGMGAELRSLVLGWALLLAFALVTFIPQLIVYQVLGGHLGPSSTVGEKLNWTAPHALQVLFAPNYGLLPWAPVVALALVGLGLLARRDRGLAVAALVAVAAQVYVAGSYATWMGASSFGQRRFVNCTVLFALGLGALIAWAIDHRVPRLVLLALAGLSIGWELGLVMQYAAFWTSADRQAGLRWPGVLADQARLVLRAPGLAWDYLFHRTQFMQRGGP